MMKSQRITIKNRKGAGDKLVELTLSLLTLTLCITLSTLLAPFVGELVKEGLGVCKSAVIPSIFPFMIIAELMTSSFPAEQAECFKRLFTRLFKMNASAISAFICGLFCGFPAGAKAARELYFDNAISRDECERLIGFTSNASPAFVIGGVGYALRGSAREGFALYLISIASSVICGILFSMRSSPSESSESAYARKKFSLARAVNSATQNTLTACGFATAFSVLTGLVCSAISNEAASALLSSLFEIGNAAKRLSSSSSLTRELSLVATAFAVSFSGFSVHLQIKSVIKDTGISMKSYYFIKLTSAILSAALCAAWLGLSALFRW